MKEVVRSACRTALLEAGFVPDEHYDNYSPSLNDGIIIILDNSMVQSSMFQNS